MDGPGSNPPLKWLFEHCVFEEASLELSAHGVVVELERKPLEVLRHLLRHAGEVVTKDELHEAVWPGRVLSDTVLTKAVSRIREVLADESQTIIKTVHGYGYRLVAAVSVQAANVAKPAPLLGLQVSEHPPLRPNWALAAHLDSGGSGEVWLVEQEKTGERRVFKFALDEEALLYLKREITLHRLLKSQLSEPAIVNLLDWNLQEPPFFIELEYLPQGSLSEWAASQGGLQSLPLELRIDLAGQIAEALAQAHAVGVLHKDLKPANVLIDTRDGTPQIRLADFGSGGVLEPGRLDALGITRMGMTQLLAGSDSNATTPLYIAPEVLAGQPCTVQSDVYALGVMLYQLLVGDFRSPLSAGWERNINDPLLLEDIALAADGNPTHRLADAGELARRLRSLEPRRHQRAEALAQQAAQQAAQAAAAQANRMVEQLRARRAGMLMAVVALLAGLLASLLLYRRAVVARQQAEAATAVAQSVSNFLNYDVLVATEQEGRDTRSLNLKQVLDEAASKVDARFVGQPEAAAQIYSALSSSFMQIGDTAAAITQRGRSWDMAKAFQQQQKDSDASLRLAAELSPVDFTRDEDFAYWQEMAELAVRRHGRQHPDSLLLRNAVALGEARQRRPAQAVASFEAIIRDAEAVPEYDVETLATHWEDLGQERAALAQFAAAEAAYRKALSLYASLHGENSYSAVTVQMRHARLLTALGRYPEADTLLTAALASSTSQRNNENALVIASRRWLAALRIEQQRFAEAEVLLSEVRRAELVARGAESQQAVYALYQLGLLREAQGRAADAATLARQALEAQDKVPLLLLSGTRRKQAERLGYALLEVRALTASSQLRAARSAWAAIAPEDIQQSAITELDTAVSLRTEGLLLRAEGQASAARSKLEAVKTLYQRFYGAQHPYVLRAEQELAGL